MTDMFISYSRRDKAFVHKIHEALASRNKDIWVDWEDIPPSAEWWKEIQSGIEAADAFICIVTPNFAQSEVCRQEVKHAVQRRKRFVPILYLDVTEPDDQQKMHPAINAHNWVFMREADDFQAGFSKLIPRWIPIWITSRRIRG
jgi:hypothetical protein